MIDKTVAGRDILPNISDAERIFADLLSGAQALPGFEYDRLKGVVDQEFAQLAGAARCFAAGAVPGQRERGYYLPRRKALHRHHGKGYSAPRATRSR